MRVAIAQIDTRPADLEGTPSRIEALSRRAVQEGAQLLVLPFAAMTGTAGAPGEFAGPSFVLDLLWSLTQVAKRVACPCLVPVSLDFGEGQGVTSALLLRDGKATPLPLLAADPAQDQDGLPVVRLGDLSWGVAFSLDDLDDFADYDYDVDAVLLLMEHPFATNDPDSALGATLSDGNLSHEAEDMGAWVVGVSSLGAYEGDVYCGGSFALDAKGQVAALAPAFEEAFLVVDVLGRDQVCAQPLEAEVYDEPLFLWQALALGLRSQVERLGSQRAALVLDGTVRASVLAALATDALGPTNVRLLLADEGKARLASLLRAPVREASLPEAPGGLGEGAARIWREGCLQAELAAWAQEEGAVPLSPLTKTDLALGGAGLGPLSLSVLPLGDVYVSDVLGLARMRNTVSPLIRRPRLDPAEVPALAGVARDGRSDEAWTAAVDKVLRARIEYARPPEELVEAVGEDGQLVRAVLEALDAGCERPKGGLVLAVTTTLVEDVHRLPGLAWSDAGHDGAWAQQAQERFMELASTYGDEAARWERMMREQGEAAAGGQAGRATSDAGEARGTDDEGLQEAVREGIRELQETLGYLGDFTVREVPQGGHERQAGGKDWSGEGGAPGESRWHFPFSEN